MEFCSDFISKLWLISVFHARQRAYVADTCKSWCVCETLVIQFLHRCHASLHESFEICFFMSSKPVFHLEHDKSLENELLIAEIQVHAMLSSDNATETTFVDGCRLYCWLLCFLHKRMHWYLNLIPLLGRLKHNFISWLYFNVLYLIYFVFILNINSNGKHFSFTFWRLPNHSDNPWFQISQTTRF